MHESHDSYAKSLYFASESLLLKGFAPIPVFGAQNSSKMKQCPIKWGRFQHSLPTQADLQNWFLHEGYGGVAVVCGAVSRLVVLDFDDPDLASEFRHLFPDLSQTYTVRSGGRGLPHFYWRLPPDLVIASKSIQGADLRGEGAYVVAPPTCVDSRLWGVENAADVRMLSKGDLRRVLAFMATAAPISPLARMQTHSRAIAPPSSSDGRPSEFRQQLIPLDELISLYHQFASRGRNNALFKVAVMARDSGWVQHPLAMCLAPIHARQETTHGVSEPYQHRYAEAVRTIASVFRRPARKPSSDEPVSFVNNQVREALLQSGQVQAARVLDGLYLSGLSVDGFFTEREACVRLMGYGIPRAAVLFALSTIAPDGLPLFPPLTPQQTALAANEPERLSNSCEMSGCAKRVKNGRGRPPRYYCLPSPETLSARFGVIHRKGDPIRETDLQSPTAYRLALHRELIKRRPGQYPRLWLAARLGISEWTTRRYEKAAEIEAQPMYYAQDITWSNLNALLPEVREAAPMSVFIEDQNGKHYPPVRGIAQRLLKLGYSLRWVQQIANYYATASAVGIPTPQFLGMPTAAHETQSAAVGIPTPHFRVTPIEVTTDYSDSKSESEAVGTPTPHDNLRCWLCESCLKVRVAATKPEACTKCERSNWKCVPDAIWRDTERLKRWWQNLYQEHHHPHHTTERIMHTPLSNPDEETFAYRLHQQTPDLSLRNARNLIRRYGMKAVGEGVKLLNERRNIYNPAGFIVTVVRSEHKFLYIDCNKLK